MAARGSVARILASASGADEAVVGAAGCGAKLPECPTRKIHDKPIGADTTLEKFTRNSKSTKLGVRFCSTNVTRDDNVIRHKMVGTVWGNNYIQRRAGDLTMVGNQREPGIEWKGGEFWSVGC